MEKVFWLKWARRLACRDGKITWVGWLIQPNTKCFHTLALMILRTGAILFLKSMTERVGSDIKRLLTENWGFWNFKWFFFQNWQFSFKNSFNFDIDLNYRLMTTRSFVHTFVRTFSNVPIRPRDNGHMMTQMSHDQVRGRTFGMFVSWEMIRPMSQKGILRYTYGI